MQKFSKNGLEWLEFELLSDIPHLKHAVFLRSGGVSTGPYSSLNVSFDVDDDENAVKTNLQRIQSHFQDTSEPIKLFWAKQCHDKDITRITSNSPIESVNYDALVTNEPGLNLMIKHADCQAAIFYDPIHKAIANVHAGWRGNVKNIYKETIEYMQKSFGSKPSELLVCISPSLGPDEAEFIHYKQELPEEFWHFQVRPTYFDLWAISTYQLQQEGILPHHIEIAALSTYSNSHDYFSFRRDKKITGRHATCVVLT
ncbi:MAG: peptidoglycan editing factor PgeF [Parachlamydiaceae bacterium]|nr:peptidoglycan editing factor PgeF [Parachlamydiaceae bacterium]